MPTGTERLVWAQGQPSNLRAVVAHVKGVRVVMGAVICWENYMPLLRYALYSQGVNLWLAPTADPRGTWESLMRTIACEGRCWVVSGNQCIKSADLPGWITGKESSGTVGEQNGAVNGTAPPSSPPVEGRRRSSVSTRTQENHEIVWRAKGNAIDESPLEETGAGAAEEDPKEFASAGGSCIVNPMGETVVGPVWNKDEELLYAEIDFDECDRGRLDFDASGHYSRMDAFQLTVQGLDMTPPP
jgi:nitrilase